MKRSTIWSVFASALLFASACGDEAGDKALDASATGTGGTAAAPGVAGGASGQASTFFPRCSDPQPDAGGDECRQCAIAHCCERSFASQCFGAYGCAAEFDRVRACFADAISDGGADDPWSIVAGCVDAIYVNPQDDATTEGLGPFPQPSPAGEVALCMVGDRPQVVVEDAGAESQDPDDGFPGVVCLDKCFPGYRK